MATSDLDERSIVTRATVMREVLEGVQEGTTELLKTSDEPPYIEAIYRQAGRDNDKVKSILKNLVDTLYREPSKPPKDFPQVVKAVGKKRTLKRMASTVAPLTQLAREYPSRAADMIQDHATELALMDAVLEQCSNRVSAVVKNEAHLLERLQARRTAEEPRRETLEKRSNAKGDRRKRDKGSGRDLHKESTTTQTPPRSVTAPPGLASKDPVGTQGVSQESHADTGAILKSIKDLLQAYESANKKPKTYAVAAAESSTSTQTRKVNEKPKARSDDASAKSESKPSRNKRKPQVDSELLDYVQGNRDTDESDQDESMSDTQ